VTKKAPDVDDIEHHRKGNLFEKQTFKTFWKRAIRDLISKRTPQAAKAIKHLG
jgi:ribosomal protein L13